MTRTTLVFILNYNTADLTTNLFNSLIPYEREDYNLYILDNGSSEAITQITSDRIIYLDHNYFYGGGLNQAFNIILQNQETYDSLLFLNSDLIVHGFNYVKALRNQIINEEFQEYETTKIVSPCIIQPGVTQNAWKQMHNWGSQITRRVDWVDFQSPMFHIDFINAVKQFPSELSRGWGLDLYSGIICNEHDWYMEVLDYVPAIHLNSQTILKNKMADYCHLAEEDMLYYFQNSPYQNLFRKLREYGFNYKYYNK